MQNLIEALLAAPEHINPAIALASRLQQLETRGEAEAIEALMRSGQVAHAIIDGEHEGRAVLEALASCGAHAPPVCSKDVPVGF